MPIERSAWVLASQHCFLLRQLALSEKFIRLDFSVAFTNRLFRRVKIPFICISVGDALFDRKDIGLYLNWPNTFFRSCSREPPQHPFALHATCLASRKFRPLPICHWMKLFPSLSLSRFLAFVFSFFPVGSHEKSTRTQIETRRKKRLFRQEINASSIENKKFSHAVPYKYQ